MTYAELKASTALLGFTDTLDELSDTAEASFRAALGRAAVQVDALRPRTGTVFLTHAPAVNLTDEPHSPSRRARRARSLIRMPWRTGSRGGGPAPAR